jgi:hypothetical protein
MDFFVKRPSTEITPAPPSSGFITGRSQWLSTIGLSVVVAVSLLVLPSPEPGFAKKKAAKGEKSQEAIDAEVKKTLEPLQTTLTDLMKKVQNRYLFSVKEADKLSEAHASLSDLMNQYPTHALLVKPAYEAAVILAQREQYLDAYQCLQFVATQFPQSPYGLKAKIQLHKLEKQLGADYFSADVKPNRPS